MGWDREEAEEKDCSRQRGTVYEEYGKRLRRKRIKRKGGENKGAMTDGEPERAKEKQRCEPDSEAPEAILPFPVSGKDDKHSSDKITAGF